MGIKHRKTIELGLGFLKFGKNNRLGKRIWAEFGGGKWDLFPPPPLQDPLHTVYVQLHMFTNL